MPTPNATHRHLTTGQAAKLCDVSQQTIIRCFDNGMLDGFRVPGSRFRRISREGLFAFMSANNIPTKFFLDSLTEAERNELLASVPPPLKLALELPSDRSERVAAMITDCERAAS